MHVFFGLPVMIDPRLTRSTLTHQCCFKCLLPWKQAADIKVCYTDNGLSASTPAAVPIIYLIFPSSTPHLSILFHPFLSRSSSLALPLFIQPDIFTSSIHQVNPSAMLSHLCLRHSFPHYFHMSHHSLHLSPFICPCVYPNVLSSPHLCYLLPPSVLFFSSVCSLDTSTQKHLQALNTALN